MLAQHDDDFDGEQIIEPQLLPGMGLAAAMPQPPTAAAAAAAAAGGGSGSDASKQRGLPWWALPQGLMSLCLSHMDLTGRGVTQCRAAGVQQQRRQEGGSSDSAGCCCCCCLAPAPAGSQLQRQQALLPGLSLGLGLFQSRSSPLRPLSKRRRQTQQRLGSGEVDVSELSGASWGCSDDGSAAGGAAGAAAAGDGEEGSAASLLSPPLCSCAAVLPAQFSSLQALWLEHVSFGLARGAITTDCNLAFTASFVPAFIGVTRFSKAGPS